MDISKIKVGNIPDKINAIIEIPYGSSVKYELVIIMPHRDSTRKG